MADQQRTIDFTRAEQLGMLRDAVLEPRDGVSAAKQKSVLRTIDDHAPPGGVCWCSFDTIAAESGCSVRTAKRAVAALVEASLLCLETRRSSVGVVCNHYRIVWSELALLRRGGTRTTPPVRSAMVSERSAMVSERSAMVSERSAMVTPAQCHHGTQTAQSEMKRKEPPPQSPSRPAAGGGWKDLIAEWSIRLGQIATLAREAELAGESCEDFAARVAHAWTTATSPANAGRIAKPAGAVVYHLRSRSWPCEGVVDAGDESAAAEALAAASKSAAIKQAAERTRTTDSARFAIARTVQRSRGNGTPREQVRLLLECTISRETLAAAGWSTVDQALDEYWI